MKYAEVILPLPLAQTYTYAIPEGMASQVLSNGRVIVPFGAKRYYTAIVREVHERPPDDLYAVKSVFTVLDEAPVLHECQLHFWEWMASYYLCTLGDVYKAAVPSGLKLGSETVVSLCDDFEASRPLSPKLQTLLDALAGEGKPQTVAEIEKKTGLHNLIPALTQLVKQGAVTVREELKRGFVPKTEIYLRLSSLYEKEADLVSVFESLRRAPKQEKLLLSFLDETKPFRGEGTPEISRKALLKTAGADPSALNGLLRRGDQPVTSYVGSASALSAERGTASGIYLDQRDVRDESRLPVARSAVVRKNGNLSASDPCDVVGGAAGLVSVAGDCRYDTDHRTVGAGVRPTSAGVSFRAL